MMKSNQDSFNYEIIKDDRSELKLRVDYIGFKWSILIENYESDYIIYIKSISIICNHIKYPVNKEAFKYLSYNVESTLHDLCRPVVLKSQLTLNKPESLL